MRLPPMPRISPITLLIVFVVVTVSLLSLKMVLDDPDFRENKTNRDAVRKGTPANSNGEIFSSFPAIRSRAPAPGPGAYEDCEVCSASSDSEQESEWDSPFASFPGAATTPALKQTSIPTPNHFQESEWTAPKLDIGERGYALSAWTVIKINDDWITIRGVWDMSAAQEKVKILPDARIETTNDQGKKVPFQKYSIKPGMMVLIQRMELPGSPDLFTRYIWVYPS